MTEVAGVELPRTHARGLLVGTVEPALAEFDLMRVALFAAVLPARGSRPGVLLRLLLVWDVIAVRVHRRHAAWGALVRLLPSVLVGVLSGSAFLAPAGNALNGRSWPVRDARRRGAQEDADAPEHGAALGSSSS